MIRNFFKERQERKVQELERDKLNQKMLKISEDKRWYDTTYVIYSSEFPNLEFDNIEKFVNAACNVGGLSYRYLLYHDNCYVFYIYVKKREEPKYNVGDIYHQKETIY